MHASLLTLTLLSLSLSVPSTLAGPSNHGLSRSHAHRRHHARSAASGEARALAQPAGQPINSPARRARVERAADEQVIKRVRRVASSSKDDDCDDGGDVNNDNDKDGGSPAGSGIANSTALVTGGSGTNSTSTSTGMKGCTEGEWLCSESFLTRCDNSAWVTIANCSGKGLVCSDDPRETGCIWSYDLLNSTTTTTSEMNITTGSTTTGKTSTGSGTTSSTGSNSGDDSGDVDDDSGCDDDGEGDGGDDGDDGDDCADDDPQPSATMSSATSTTAAFVTASAPVSMRVPHSVGITAAPSSSPMPSQSAIGGNLLAPGESSSSAHLNDASSSTSMDWSNGNGNGKGDGASSSSKKGSNHHHTSTSTNDWSGSSTTDNGSASSSTKDWSAPSASASASNSSYDGSNGNQWGQSSTMTTTTKKGHHTSTMSAFDGGASASDSASASASAMATGKPSSGSGSNLGGGSVGNWKAPHMVIYADNWLNTMPSASEIGNYNRFILAFWMSNSGAVDDAQAWEQFSQSYRQQVLDEYHAAGIALMVSAFGSTDAPTSWGYDPTSLAQDLASWVKQYGLDGVDIDYEDMNAMNSNQAETWIITFQQALRAALGDGYLISHAPVAPWFTSSNAYASGAYVKIHQVAGDTIDFYNVQFYNQGNIYVDCESLINNSGSDWPDTSVMQINSYAGVPLDKIVIGKPNDASAADNGYMDPSNLATCVAQAQSQGWNGGVMFWEWAGNHESLLSNLIAIL